MANHGIWAALVLTLHLIVINFNLFGLIAIPLGGLFGWRFVRVRWWRLLHLASLAVVALQAVAGRGCFLTLMQAALSESGDRTPLIMAAITRLIYWPLPIWVFAAIYVCVFCLVSALWWVVPPSKTMPFGRCLLLKTRRSADAAPVDK